MFVQDRKAAATKRDEVTRRLEFESVEISTISPIKSGKLLSFQSTSTPSSIYSIPDKVSEASTLDSDSDSDSEQSKLIGQCAFRRHVELAMHKGDQCGSVISGDGDIPPMIKQRKETPLLPDDAVPACGVANVVAMDISPAVVELVEQLVTTTSDEQALQDTVVLAPLRNGTVPNSQLESADQPVFAEPSKSNSQRAVKSKLKRHKSVKKQRSKEPPYSFRGVLPVTMADANCVERASLALLQESTDATANHKWEVGDTAQATYDGQMYEVTLTEAVEQEDDYGVRRKCYLAKWPNKRDSLKASKFPLFPEQLRVPVKGVIELPDFGKSRHPRIKAICSAAHWNIGRRFTAVDCEVHEVLRNDGILKLLTDTNNQTFSYLRVVSGTDKASIVTPNMAYHMKTAKGAKAQSVIQVEKVTASVTKAVKRKDSVVPPHTDLSLPPVAKQTQIAIASNSGALRDATSNVAIQTDPSSDAQGNSHYVNELLQMLKRTPLKDVSMNTDPMCPVDTVDCEAATDDEFITLEIPPHNDYMTLNLILTSRGLESVLVPEESFMSSTGVAPQNTETDEKAETLAFLTDLEPPSRVIHIGSDVSLGDNEVVGADGQTSGFDPLLSATAPAEADDDDILGNIFASPQRDNSMEQPDLQLHSPIPRSRQRSGSSLEILEEVLAAQPRQMAGDDKPLEVPLQPKAMTQTEIIRKGKKVLCTKRSYEMTQKRSAEGELDLDLEPQKRKRSAPPPAQPPRANKLPRNDSAKPLPPTPIPLNLSNAEQTLADDEFQLPLQTPPKSSSKVDADGLGNDWTQPNIKQPFLFMRKKSECNILMSHFRNDCVHVTTQAREGASKILSSIDVSILTPNISKGDMKEVVNNLRKATRSFIADIYGLKTNRVVLFQENPKMVTSKITPAELIQLQPPPLKEALQYIYETCQLEKTVGMDVALKLLNTIIDRFQGNARAAKRRSQKQ